MTPKSQVVGSATIRYLLHAKDLVSRVVCSDLLQGVFAGVLVSENFKEQFPQVRDANISGITSSCFFVRIALLFLLLISE